MAIVLAATSPACASAQSLTVVYPQQPDASGLRAIVQDAMRELLIKEPELIANALQAAQSKQAQEAQAAQVAAAQAAVQAAGRAKIDPKVPSIGPDDGKMVVEFFDYNCGHCKNFASQTYVGVNTARKDVRWAFVYAPVLGEGSVRLAEFAAAAQLQGKFELVHHYLLAQQQSFTTAEAADAIRKQLIAATGLDRARFDAALKSGEARAIIDHHRTFLEQAQLKGTPMIVTGTTYIPGFVPAEVLLQHIH
jgi:protein-disulfide isomerase